MATILNWRSLSTICLFSITRAPLVGEILLVENGFLKILLHSCQILINCFRVILTNIFWKSKKDSTRCSLLKCKQNCVFKAISAKMFHQLKYAISRSWTQNGRAYQKSFFESPTFDDTIMFWTFYLHIKILLKYLCARFHEKDFILSVWLKGTHRISLIVGCLLILEIHFVSLIVSTQTLLYTVGAISLIMHDLLSHN